jgi:plastocyanin
MKKLGLLIATVALVISSFFFNTATASAETFTVKMGGDGGTLQFDPPALTIKAGDTFKWLNKKLNPNNLFLIAPRLPKRKRANYPTKVSLFPPVNPLKVPSANRVPTLTTANLIAVLAW